MFTRDREIQEILANTRETLKLVRTLVQAAQFTAPTGGTLIPLSATKGVTTPDGRPLNE